jgi:hypothetical protein
MDRMTRVAEELMTDADRFYPYTPEDTSAVQCAVYQQDWRISNNYAFTLSLPPVSEAKGRTYVFSVDSATAAVTLTDFGSASFNDSINWEGDYTLDAAEDRIVLKSNGREWIVLENQIAT